MKLQHLPEITNTQQGRLPVQSGQNLGGTRMGSPGGTRPGDHKSGHLWVEKGPRPQGGPLEGMEEKGDRQNVGRSRFKDACTGQNLTPSNAGDRSCQVFST